MGLLANDFLRNGNVVESSAADNATATATVAAQTSVAPAGLGQSHYVAGFSACYSAAPAAGYRTITVKKGSTTLFTLRWDFATAGNILPTALPLPIHGSEGQAVSVELQASGTGGVTGTVCLFYAPV